MSLTYGFFNSLDGDRVYTAENVNTMFEGLISNGVYANFQDAFKVNAAGGLNITVGTGRAVVGNRWVKNDAAITLTLNAAHVTLNRYTKICLRADTGTRTVSLLAVDGENGSSPVKPVPVRTSTQYDAVLAYVYVPAGASVITASQIQDTRADTSVCGFVASLVQQLDTSELFTQYEAAYEEQLDDMHDWQAQKEDDFDSWFGTLTDDLLVQTYVESGRAVSCANLSDLTKITVPETLPFDMAAGDILQLYIGGILLPKDRYTVALSSGAYVVTYPAGFISGNPVEFVMYKSVIGYNSQSGGGGGGGGSLTQTEKNLLLTLASKSAYAEDDAGTAYDALETIWSTTSYSVSWSGNGYTKGNNATSVIEGSTFTSTVTANTGFTITSVTATMGGATVTGAWSGGTVTIPNVTGNIVITVVTSQRTVSSISAVYTQSGTVYDTDSLDSLKSDLVVTANYSGGTSETVPASDYTLSGTLTVGTSTVTVSYAGLTTTFSVTVSEQRFIPSQYTWLYDPRNNVLFSESGYATKATGGTGGTETLSNGELVLNTNYSSSSQSNFTRFNFNDTTTTNGILSCRALINECFVTSSTDSPTSYRLQLSNGNNGAQAFVADNNGLISIIYFTGSSKHKVNTEYRMDEYHVFELSLANGAQTMSIDGEQIFTSSTLSSNYCTANAILNQAGQVGANPNGTNVSVDWIAYYEVA